MPWPPLSSLLLAGKCLTSPRLMRMVAKVPPSSLLSPYPSAATPAADANPDLSHRLTDPPPPHHGRLLARSPSSLPSVTRDGKLPTPLDSFPSGTPLSKDVAASKSVAASLNHRRATLAASTFLCPLAAPQPGSFPSSALRRALSPWPWLSPTSR
jgi:hypothetical protein